MCVLHWSTPFCFFLMLLFDTEHSLFSLFRMENSGKEDYLQPVRRFRGRAAIPSHRVPPSSISTHKPGQPGTGVTDLSKVGIRPTSTVSPKHIPAGEGETSFQPQGHMNVASVYASHTDTKGVSDLVVLTSKQE